MFKRVVTSERELRTLIGYPNERAVQKEVFAQTVAAVQARNANVPDERIEEAIEDALREVRAERWGPLKRARAKRKR